MALIAERYDDARYRQAWTQLLEKSARRNILAKRDFFDYHGARLEDFSLVFLDKPGGKITGVLPAARRPGQSERVSCHVGSSLGGLIFKKPASPEQTAEAFHAAALVWREQGIASLDYKTTPSFFDTQPDETDIFVLGKCAAKVEHKFWQTIDLKQALVFSSGLEREARAAAKNGFQTTWSRDQSALSTMHKMVCDNLADRHDAEPLHSLAEVGVLHTAFEAASEVLLVSDADGAPAASAWMLRYAKDVWHPQYIASTPAGRSGNAVKLLLMTALERYQSEGVRWLSLGTSSGSGSFGVDDTLFQFKRRFGAGVVLQYFFDVELSALSAATSSS